MFLWYAGAAWQGRCALACCSRLRTLCCGSIQLHHARHGLALVFNVCFSLRGLLGKRLSTRYQGGDVEVFFQLCLIGALLQSALLLVTSGTLIRSAGEHPQWAGLGVALLNGATFYAYLCLVGVFGRMTAVSHSVANCCAAPLSSRRWPFARRALTNERRGHCPRLRSSDVWLM